MNFGFTEEQDLLRAQARQFLDETSPLSAVREVVRSEPGFSRKHWGQLSELGWNGIALPEAHGGAGLGWVDLVVLLEEMGRGLYPGPFASTALAAAAVLDGGSAGQQARWLPGLAHGSLIGTLAIQDGDAPDPDAIELCARTDGDALVLDGEKPFVHAPGLADLFVVAFRQAGALRLAVVERDRAGVEARSFPTLDRTKQLGSLYLTDVRLPRENLLARADRSVVERTLARGAIAMTAEMLGAAEAAHALTVTHARDRVQFGEPIGRFQGVKHPLADMYVAIESAKSLLYYAAWTLDEAPDEVVRAASMAKAYASEAFARVGIDAIQLHGAVGYTDEYDVQLYLKRSKWARPAFGDPDFHYERVAQLGGL